MASLTIIIVVVALIHFCSLNNIEDHHGHPGPQASPADHGNWMCLVNDNLQFNAIKKFVTILVGVEAVTGLTLGGPTPISPMKGLLLYCPIPGYNVK